MDPNENLRKQRALAARIIAISDNEDAPNEEQRELEEAAAELAELVRALDVWITTGGFLPSAWFKAERVSAE